MAGRGVHIRTKVIIGFSVILLLMTSLAVIGVSRAVRISAGLVRIDDVNAVKRRYAINLRGSVHDRSIAIRDMVLIQENPVLTAAVKEEIEDLHESYKESDMLLNEIFENQENTVTDEEREVFAAVKAEQKITEPVIYEILELIEEGERESARLLLLETVRPLFAQWINTINQFINLQESYSSVIADETRFLARGFALLVTVAAATALIFGILFGLWTIRSLNPLRAIGDALREISEGHGDLTMRLNDDRDDEVGRVALEFNSFVSGLSGTIGSVREGVKQLGSASTGLVQGMQRAAGAVRDITRSIEDVRSRVSDNQAPEVNELSAAIAEIASIVGTLSSGIEQQAQTIENSTAAVEEMIASVKSVTQNLERNAERFGYLQKVADTGSERISEVNRMVAGIAEQSQGVFQANETINNVAAQTNLLAMNAAIEAAHAGEAGRGFAVVADEIRKLAENSSTQSKSISSVLKSLQQSIDEVVSRSADAGSAFDSVQDAIRTVVRIQEQIKGSMDEQSVGNQQVLESFQLINELTRKVRDGSRQMTTGSQSAIERIDGLVDTTREIEHQVDAMNRSTEAIVQTITETESLTEHTRLNVDSVETSVGRFKVD